jgi:hypothetical protein
MGRVEKLENAAREKGHLEPDESVQEVAMAKSGLPVEKGLKGAGAMMSRFALLATDRKLYGVKLGQIGSSIKDVVLEIPIGDAVVDRNGNQLKVGRKGEGAPLWVFTTAPYFSGAKDLVAYVESRP